MGFLTDFMEGVRDFRVVGDPLDNSNRVSLARYSYQDNETAQVTHEERNCCRCNHWVYNTISTQLSFLLFRHEIVLW